MVCKIKTRIGVVVDGDFLGGKKCRMKRLAG